MKTIIPQRKKIQPIINMILEGKKCMKDNPEIIKVSAVLKYARKVLVLAKKVLSIANQSLRIIS